MTFCFVKVIHLTLKALCNALKIMGSFSTFDPTSSSLLTLLAFLTTNTGSHKERKLACCGVTSLLRHWNFGSKKKKKEDGDMSDEMIAA